ncbi:MAG: polyphosphate kinase 2 [Alphaproteobacteria bacterium]|nr:MAG: polyphosphate kinase 2 [Alphaproteobacteria bacterium]
MNVEKHARSGNGKSHPPARLKPGAGAKADKLSRKDYEKKLEKLQIELCHLQDWVREKQARVVILFEGRDTAGKGGTIRAITERVSPRTFRIAALSAPVGEEGRKLFMQRYIEHFPLAGEVVIFDRSWYNRAGVERVMGYADRKKVKTFLDAAPRFERWMVENGIILVKLWLEVGKDEQERRFRARIEDPLRQWKLSPMDLKSYSRWYDYSRARDDMLKGTDHEHARWHILPSDDKKRARLNGIAHILSLIPYKKIKRARHKLPKRSEKERYDDRLDFTQLSLVPQIY